MTDLETMVTLRLLSEHEGIPGTVIDMLTKFIADGDTTYLRDGTPHGDMRAPVDSRPRLDAEKGEPVADLCSGYEGRVWVTPHLRAALLYWFQHENGYASRDTYSARFQARRVLDDPAVRAWIGFVP